MTFGCKEFKVTDRGLNIESYNNFCGDFGKVKSELHPFNVFSANRNKQIVVKITRATLFSSWIPRPPSWSY